MDQPHKSTWNCTEIWNDFVSNSKNKKMKFEIDFYVHMIDFFSNTLHQLWQKKCKKLEETQKDFGEFMLCTSCNDLLIDGITLLCGHAYCRKCLEKRETESYVELCHRCDKNCAKCFFMRQTSLDKYSKNVALNAMIDENFTNELQAIVIRKEGNQFMEKKDYSNASQKYKTAVEISPTSFMSWSNLSQVKSTVKEYQEALHAAQMSIKISPSWPKGYYREGIALKGLSCIVDSAMSFFKYLVLEPSSVAVKKILAECLLELVKSNCIKENKNNHQKELITSMSEETIMKYTEDLMKDFLQNMIEFCLLYNPSSCCFPKQNKTTQHCLDSLKNYFSCPLCCRLFYEPTTTPCGHTFCVKCLERSLDFNNSCSICRNPLDELIILKPKPIDEIIDTLVKKYFEKEYEERNNLALGDKEVLQYENSEEGIAHIPIFICTPVLPTTACPLHVFEPRYKLMIRRCLSASSKVFGMCMYDEINGFSEYGTLLEIRDNRYLDDGRLLVDTIGGKRFKVLERGSRDGYAIARVQFFSDSEASNRSLDELNVLANEIYNESKEFLLSLPYFVQSNVRLHYDDLPEMNEGEGDELGPKWTWYMVRLLVIQNEKEDIVNALQCVSLHERLLSIRQNILRMKTEMGS